MEKTKRDGDLNLEAIETLLKWLEEGKPILESGSFQEIMEKKDVLARAAKIYMNFFRGAFPMKYPEMCVSLVDKMIENW